MTQVDDPHVERQMRVDDLGGTAAGGDEPRPQRLVAPRHLPKARRERRGVEPAEEPRCRRDVVEGAARLQLIEEPQTPLRTREMTCVASSEWPPRSKKLSWTPTRSRPSTSAQTLASTSSTCVRGAAYSPPPPPAASGTGRRLRSTFPFGVKGNSSSTTNCEGTMYSGSPAFRCPRSPAAVGACPPFA